MSRPRWAAGIVLASLVVTATDSPAPSDTSAETSLDAPTSSVRDLGALGSSSRAVDVDGDLVVGEARLGAGDRAVAIDLADPRATWQDLGTLGGPESNVADVDGTTVVGWADINLLTDHAFALDLSATDPVMQDLGTLGGQRSRAAAVDGSVVVGWSRTTPPSRVEPSDEEGRTWPDERAFALDLSATDPVMQDLGTLGGDTSAATAVEGTVVVGTAATGHGQHAFMLDLATADPVMQDLGTLGGPVSRAVAISDGVVVGRSRTATGPWHAFAYDLRATDPVMQDLGTLGGRSSSASATSQGTVVGTAATGHGQHAFVFDLDAAQPVMQDLGNLGAGDSAAVDVDDHAVTGWSFIPVGGTRHAFAYDLSRPGEGIQDLGPLPRWYSAAVAVQGDTVVGQSQFGQDRTYRAAAWRLARTTRPVLAFSRFRYGVGERAGHVTVVVERAGRADRAVSVGYRARATSTLRRSATPRDFTKTSGTLRFAPGERRQSFRIRIVDDARSEGREDFVVILRSPSQPAELGTPSMAVVRIRANDDRTGQ